MKFTPFDLSCYFGFLDDLRDGGSTNMMGARPLLARQYELDRETSAAAHSAWMQTFDEGKSAGQRADEYIAAQKNEAA